MTLWEFLNNFKFTGVGYKHPEVEILVTDDYGRKDSRVYCDYWINDSKITRDMLLGKVVGLEYIAPANRVVILIHV